MASTETSLFVNHQGFATCTLRGTTLPHLYTFAHFLDEPYFTPLNHLRPAEGMQFGQPCRFRKTYLAFSGDAFNTEQEIIAEGDEMRWEIRTTEDRLGGIVNNSHHEENYCCFGISLAVDDDFAVLPNGDKSQRILNYSQKWLPAWEGQTCLDLPIFKIRVQGKDMLVTAPATADLQFVFYKDNGQSYLKIGTKSSDAKDLVARFFARSVDDLRAAYKDIYPESAWKVDFWKTTFEKLSYQYGVTVVYDQPIERWGHTAQIPNEIDVRRYADLLWREMKHYPPQIFQQLELQRIHLCTGLHSQEKRLYGFVSTGTLNVDVGEDVPDCTKIVTLHHEIFHLIETCGTEPPTITDEQFVIRASLTQHAYKPAEIRADLFALCIADSSFICEERIKSPALDKDIDALFRFVQKVCPGIEMPQSKQTDAPKYQHILLQSRESTRKEQATKNLVQQTDFGVVEWSDSNQYTISGIPGSGRSLVASLFRLNQNTHLVLVDASIVPSVYLVRNPLDVAAWHFHRERAPAEVTLARWAECYEKWAVSHRPYIRYEDLARLNKTKINQWAARFRVTPDIGVVDPDKIREYDPMKVPFLSRLWQSMRNRPIVSFFGYNLLECKHA